MAGARGRFRNNVYMSMLASPDLRSTCVFIPCVTDLQKDDVVVVLVSVAESRRVHKKFTKQESCAYVTFQREGY